MTPFLSCNQPCTVSASDYCMWKWKADLIAHWLFSKYTAFETKGFLSWNHYNQEVWGKPYRPVCFKSKTNVLLELSVQLLYIVLLIQDGCYLAIPVVMETDIKTALHHIWRELKRYYSVKQCKETTKDSTSLHSCSHRCHSSSTWRSQWPQPERIQIRNCVKTKQI